MRKQYLEIIKKAQNENRKRGEIYYELHHILPKSLFPLWTKRESNLVLLTAKEHILCHKLLAKIYGGKMWVAYHRLSMDKRNGHELTPEEYEELKIQFSIIRKTDKDWNNKIGKGNFGKIRTKEQKIHQSEIMTGKKLWPNGRVFSKETKKKMSLAKKGTHCEKIQKKVICLETKKIYYVTEANKLFNGRIDKMIKTGIQSYYQKGKQNLYHWSYYDITKDDKFWDNLLVNIKNIKRECKFHQAEYKCIETGEIFIGAKLLKEKYKGSSSSFARHIRGEKENFAGFHFIKLKSQY